MKSLFFGIFAIIIIGVLFFTFQVVKSPTFGKLSISKTSSKQVNSETKRFVDIQKGFSFEYPAYGKMADPRQTPGYAPVLYFEKKTTSAEAGAISDKTNNEGAQTADSASLIGTGYVAISQKDLPRLRNVNEEIIEYSEGKEIKSLIAHYINKNENADDNDADENAIEITATQARRLTFKGGSNGAVIPFSATISSDNSNTGDIVEGNIYLYESTGKLSYGVSLFVRAQNGDVYSTEFKEAKAAFLNNEAEKIMQSMQFLN